MILFLLMHSLCVKVLCYQLGKIFAKDFFNKLTTENLHNMKKPNEKSLKSAFLSCFVYTSIPPFSLLSSPLLPSPPNPLCPGRPSLQVCQVTLQLLDILLQCSLPSVLRELVFGHPAGSTCATPTTGNSITSKLDDMAAERQDLEDTISKCVEPHLPTAVPSLLSPLLSFSLNPPPSYLSLVPAQLLSAEDVTGDTGIEQYLIEAHQQVCLYHLPTQPCMHTC